MVHPRRGHESDFSHREGSSLRHTANETANETVCQLRRRGWKRSARHSAAVAASAEDFEEVAVDLEVVLQGQRVGQVTHRTSVKRNGRATAGADEMMTVDRRAGNINRASRTVENAGKYAERGQDLQRAIDRRAAALAAGACGDGDKLLRRKWPFLS